MDISFSNRFVIGSFLVGPIDDLVIDVCKVTDESDLISTILKIAIDHIEDDGRPGMANMTEVVNRDTANVHSNLILETGNKFLFLA